MPVRCENKEIVAPHLILILEDEPLINESWQNCFQSPDFKIISIEQRRDVGTLTSLNKADLDRVRLIIVDQGLIDRTGLEEFIKNIREENKDVSIMETSGASTQKILPDSNVAIHSYHDTVALCTILKQTSSTSQKLAKIKYYSSREAIKAQKFDPHGEWWQSFEHPEEEFETFLKFRDQSEWTELSRHPSLPFILEALSTDEEGLSRQHRSFNQEDKSLLLHHCWNILSVIKPVNVEDFDVQNLITESTSFARLQSLLNNNQVEEN
jgi:hypothetical protein